MKQSIAFPHESVYVRIGRSSIHGVGLIAIIPIAKGTDLFPTDQSELNWIRIEDLPSMDPSRRKLYEDFCVQKNGSYGCPTNFNELTVSWYLNHSDSPNVRCDSKYHFFALRDIEAGEELTVNYRSFSEGKLPGDLDKTSKTLF